MVSTLYLLFKKKVSSRHLSFFLLTVEKTVVLIRVQIHVKATLIRMVELATVVLVIAYPVVNLPIACVSATRIAMRLTVKVTVELVIITVILIVVPIVVAIVATFLV